MKIRSADVVIIGGGVIGTSIAYYLSKERIKATLVEREDIVSGTSSAGNGGLMLQTKAPGIKLKIALKSTRIYQHLGEELGEDIEYERHGGMVIAENQDELDYARSLTERQKKSGLRVKFLDRNEIQRYQPALSDHVLGSAYSPADAKVNPMKLTFSFAKAAKRQGANICTSTEVKDIKVRKDKVNSVVTDNGIINTNIVVNAAGIWAPYIGKMVGVDIPIRPRRGMLMVTEALPPLIKGSIISSRYLMSKLQKVSKATGEFTGGLAIRQTKRGNLVFGSSREFVGYNKRVTYEGVRSIATWTTKVLPVLKDINVIRIFAGLRPATPDGLPILEEVQKPKGFIIAAGHEGDGFCLAPITGKFITQLITEKTPPELAHLNLARFEC